MELAKSQSELRCLEDDCKKVKGRISFVISGIHALKDKDIKE